ncbi:MAG: hypothetical protein ACFFAK_16090 [Promethearchaeota archaeon]
MAKSLISNVLNLLAIMAMIAIILFLGPNALGITLAILVGVGICFFDFWIFYAKRGIQRSIRKKRQEQLVPQKYVICPRCKIPVEIELGICPKCKNRV